MQIPRRIVTGIKNERSTIIEDEIASNIVEHFPGFMIADLWATNQMPVQLDNFPSVANKLFPNTPKNGSYFRYVHIPPDTEILPYVNGTNNNEIHPLMHCTQTLDYIAILSGEIYLILEDGETLVRSGDIVIQRATNHGWSNRSNIACIMLAILLDADHTQKYKAS